MPSIVAIVIFAVGLTTVPLLLELSRTVLPRRRGLQRFHQPILLLLVVGLCLVVYYFFWQCVLPYSYPRASWLRAANAVLCSTLWLNGVAAYGLCMLVGAERIDREAPIERAEHGGGGGGPPHARWCALCQANIALFDHHCPFTGGCVGGRNLRFFVLFVGHAWAGMGYAAWLSFFPFRDCVLGQLEAPRLGLVRTPPPSDDACLALGARSLLFLPALCLHLVLGMLLALHVLLLANGLTTAQVA
jgi:hypothetical protein